MNTLKTLTNKLRNLRGTDYAIILLAVLCIILGSKYIRTKQLLAFANNRTIAANKQIDELIETNATIKQDNEELTTKVDVLTSDYELLKGVLESLSNEHNVVVDSYTEAIATKYRYSALDYEYLLRMAETETYQCDMMSKTHVISVALNRCELYGMTPYEVITSPSQFVYHRTNISQSTIDALEYVLENGDTSNGALYFYSGESASPTWQDREYIFTDDAGHHFY